jgi:hypothetical protein
LLEKIFGVGSFGAGYTDCCKSFPKVPSPRPSPHRLVQSLTNVADAHDFEDRLINRNSGEVLVSYDGDGNRVAKTVGGVTTLFLVDDRNPTCCCASESRPSSGRTISTGN